MDLRSFKVIGIAWNLRSAWRNRWSATPQWVPIPSDRTPTLKEKHEPPDARSEDNTADAGRICLSGHGKYITKMLSWDSAFPVGPELQVLQELKLCLYQTTDGSLKVTFGDKPPTVAIPKPPAPDEPPKTVRTFAFTDELKISASRRVHLALPPTLPEHPTAKERWQYLLEVVKHKA